MDRFVFSESLLVKFPVTRVRFPEALWVAEHFYGPEVNDECHRFTLDFGYAIEGNECFENFKFDTSFRAVFTGERYGGRGIGDNGGGVRCGNFSGYQIKGVGKNPLVGNEKLKWHAYGGLNAPDAIYEAIYAHLINKYLPVGAAKVYGIILTSPDGSYYEHIETIPKKELRGWGALLVREICIRPGHFIRAEEYFPRKDLDVEISDDVVRVRHANKSLFRHFGENKKLVHFLGKFLSNSASQFAFSKLARITHGGISASNLCFDGRWIDLTNCTLYEGGENIGGIPPSNEEAFEIIPILHDFIDTFCKYNDLTIATEKLDAYYAEALSSYFTEYLPQFYGVEYSSIRHIISRDAFKDLLCQTRYIVNPTTPVKNQWPNTLSHDNSALILQESLFLSLENRELANRILGRFSHIKGFDAKVIITAFRIFIDESFQAEEVTPFSQFKIQRCAAVCLKRTLYAEYFFKIGLDAKIKAALSKTTHDVRLLIKESIALTEWIFEEINSTSVTLFKREAFKIMLLSADGYVVFHRETMLATFKTADHLIEYLIKSHGHMFIVQEYNFLRPLIRMCKTFTAIEKGK